MNVSDMIKEAVDLHVHVGPEIIPRKYDAYSLAKSQIGKLKKICIKSHCFSTVSWAEQINKIVGNDFLLGSITLNNFVGGMNADAIYAASKISKSPFIVWFPTIHAENFMRKSKEEFKKEWINNPNFTPRKTKGMAPVEVVRKGKLTKEVVGVLKMIKNSNCMLATGHISWREAELVVNKALEVGIKKIIVTHPIYQLISMPVEVQKRLAKKGAFIEHCYSMHSIDKISYDKLVGQIQEIGAERCILSSDVGQTFSPDPDKALADFAKSLIKKGIAKEEICEMLVENPAKLIS